MPPPEKSRSRKRTIIFAAIAAVVLAVGSLFLALSNRGSGVSAPVPATNLPPVGALKHPGVHLGQLLNADARDRSGCGPPKLAGINSAWEVTWENDSSNVPDLVARQAKHLGLLDFFWLSLAGARDIATSDQYAPSVDTEMSVVHNSHPCTLGFVTLADNVYMKDRPRNLNLMAHVLMDPRIQWQFVLAVDRWMYDHPTVDGFTLDFEYGLPENQDEMAAYATVGHWGKNLTLRQEVDSIGTGYDRLVWSLTQAMHRLHRQIRVAALTRPTDVIQKDHVSPFVLNYGNWPVDQVVLMATGYSYSTGDPGAIAPFKAVSHDVGYVLSYPGMDPSKLTVEVPVYGYNWRVNPDHPKLIAKYKGQAIEAEDLSQTGVVKLLRQHPAVVIRSADGDTHWQFIQDGQPHVVWDAATALKQAVANLHRTFAGCGIAVFRIGNSDPAGWKLVRQALG